jgi:hypothetical protein
LPQVLRFDAGLDHGNRLHGTCHKTENGHWEWKITVKVSAMGLLAKL